MEQVPRRLLILNVRGPGGHDIALSGRLDVRTVPDARLELHALVDGDDRPIRLDLAECTLGDSTALGLIVEVLRRSHRAGRAVRIVAADARTRRLLRRTRVCRLLGTLEPEALPELAPVATA